MLHQNNIPLNIEAIHLSKRLKSPVFTVYMETTVYPREYLHKIQSLKSKGVIQRTSVRFFSRLFMRPCNDLSNFNIFLNNAISLSYPEQNSMWGYILRGYFPRFSQLLPYPSLYCRLTTQLWLSEADFWYFLKCKYQKLK